MVEIIINDGFLGQLSGEDRIIRLVSANTYKHSVKGATYNEEDVKASVKDLMKFFYRYTSAGFVDELTEALNQRDRFKDV